MLGCITLLHRISFFGGAMRPGCQVTSVVHTKETLLLQRNVQTTKSRMKEECYCLIPTNSLATSARSTET